MSEMVRLGRTISQRAYHARWCKGSERDVIGVGPPLVSPSGAWSLGESWRPNYHYPKNEPYAPSIKRPDLAQGQIKAWSYPGEASRPSCQVAMLWRLQAPPRNPVAST